MDDTRSLWLGIHLHPAELHAITSALADTIETIDLEEAETDTTDAHQLDDLRRRRHHAQSARDRILTAVIEHQAVDGQLVELPRRRRT